MRVRRVSVLPCLTPVEIIPGMRRRPRRSVLRPATSGLALGAARGPWGCALLARGSFGYRTRMRPAPRRRRGRESAIEPWVRRRVTIAAPFGAWRPHTVMACAGRPSTSFSRSALPVVDGGSAPAMTRRDPVSTPNGAVIVVRRIRSRPPNRRWKPRDLFDLLRAARDPDSGAGFSPAELRDQVATMILAGHETSAVAFHAGCAASATVCLSAVWRRSPDLRRRTVCADRGRHHSGVDLQAVPGLPDRRPAGPARRDHHDAARPPAPIPAARALISVRRFRAGLPEPGRRVRRRRRYAHDPFGNWLRCVRPGHRRPAVGGRVPSASRSRNRAGAAVLHPGAAVASLRAGP